MKTKIMHCVVNVELWRNDGETAVASEKSYIPPKKNLKKIRSFKIFFRLKKTSRKPISQCLSVSEHSPVRFHILKTEFADVDLG